MFWLPRRSTTVSGQWAASPSFWKLTDSTDSPPPTMTSCDHVTLVTSYIPPFLIHESEVRSAAHWNRTNVRHGSMQSSDVISLPKSNILYKVYMNRPLGCWVNELVSLMNEIEGLAMIGTVRMDSLLQTDLMWYCSQFFNKSEKTWRSKKDNCSSAPRRSITYEIYFRCTKINCKLIFNIA